MMNLEEKKYRNPVVLNYIYNFEIVWIDLVKCLNCWCTQINFSLKPSFSEFQEASREKAGGTPDLNQGPGSSFGDVGPLPCARRPCVWIFSRWAFCLPSWCFTDSCSESDLHISSVWGGQSFLDQTRPRIFLKEFQSFNIGLFEAILYFFQIFMSPVCIGCCIICTAEFHTNINLYRSHLFLYFKEAEVACSKALTYERLLWRGSSSFEGCSPLSR